ncbi:hypothetical protein SNK04_009273 [Fusarium graminearum]
MTSITDIQALYSKYCDDFHRQGARCVVITLGHRGVLASYLEPPDANDNSGQRTFFYPATKRSEELVDETGASDAFIAIKAPSIAVYLYQINTRSDFVVFVVTTTINDVQIVKSTKIQARPVLL